MRTFNTAINQVNQTVEEGALSKALRMAGLAGAMAFAPMHAAETNPEYSNMPANLGGKLNNPGNIRYASKVKWEGQTGKGGGFSKFANPEYGARAIFKLLKTYSEKYHLNTIRGIISKFAPPHENNTSTYIQEITDAMNRRPFGVVADMRDPKKKFTPDTVLDMTNSLTQMALIKSIIKKEIGYDAPDSLLQMGLIRSL